MIQPELLSPDPFRPYKLFRGLGVECVDRVTPEDLIECSWSVAGFFTEKQNADEYVNEFVGTRFKARILPYVAEQIHHSASFELHRLH